MKISGLQKLTLLDFPGKVACTVFLGGCNFRCPFCHNFELVDGSTPPLMEEGELLAFLKSRRGVLDGVCITGGEPTLQPRLAELLREIKSMGYQVKLDTNGYRPEVLRSLVAEGLVDYVAMDVKNGPDLYGTTVGLDGFDLSPIEESIRFLLEGRVDYEFRTTAAEPLHTEQSVADLSRWLLSLEGEHKARQLFLQPFVDRDTVPVAGLSAPDKDTLAAFLALLSPCAEHVSLRGA